MELTKAEIDRFRNKFDEKGKDECWEWLGAKYETGYGMVSLRRGTRKTYTAHRISWAFHNKMEIPHGLMICHTCDNRLCVNPNHLYAGTSKQNNMDTVNRNRGNRKLGSACSWSKLTEENVRHILSSCMKQTELAAMYRVDPSTICQIKSRKRWGHLSR